MGVEGHPNSTIGIKVKILYKQKLINNVVVARTLIWVGKFDARLFSIKKSVSNIIKFGFWMSLDKKNLLFKLLGL